MRRITLVLAVVLSILPALASQPGQPIDCSDWVFNDPRLSCAVFAGGPNPPFLVAQTDLMVVDNDGGFLSLNRVNVTLPCDTGFITPHRHQILRFNGSSTTVLGYVTDRCGSVAGQLDLWSENQANVAFDAVRGRLLFNGESGCIATNGGTCNSNPYNTVSILAIEGFTPLFEILQSYQPASASFSFTVPLRPEGLDAVDRFDTYYGTLPGPIDFAQAHPLQCDYPSAVPQAGDHMVIADTLPVPAPGHGYWYVTAASYQGQTRYGRWKLKGQETHGRDPALLPACNL
jgi:hypothetical protein